MPRRPSLKSLVEEKAGRCRGLAMAIRDEAAAVAPWRRHDRLLLERWADTLDAIADGLTEASNADDPPRLRAWISTCSAVALAVIGGAAGGIAQWGAPTLFESERIEQCATEVLDGLDVLDRLAQGDHSAFDQREEAPPHATSDSPKVSDESSAPPESVKTPLDRLAEAFPGSELLAEDAGGGAISSRPIGGGPLSG